MVENSYVPVFPTDNYNKQQSVKKTKGLSLKDLGLKSDPKGGLTIDDPTAFISELGLSDAYANNLMTNGIEFKDFDEFQNFINTAVESGNTTKSDDFYNDIFAEDARLEKDSRIQSSSAGRSETAQAAADKAFGIKPKPATPAPQNQAQAARPNLDQPDGAGATSAAALAAAQGMPDFINRLGGNGRFANQAKLQMMQEAKRRQQNELAALQKSEKAAKRAGEVDEILNAKNDQYRQLFANSSKDRSAEDWDAMGRDQKIKMIQNYNINQSLGPAKTLESPDAPKTAQAKPAAVRPDGSPVSQAYFDQFFNNPDVPDFGNIADQPPAGMAPVYGPEGKIGYKSRSETAEAAKNYAKKSMRNNPMSTTGNVFSGNMERLYPSLPVNRFKEEVDFDETEKQKKYNPFS